MKKFPFMHYSKLLRQNFSRWSLKTYLVLYFIYRCHHTQLPIMFVAFVDLSVVLLCQNTQQYKYHPLTVIKTTQISCTLSLLIFDQGNWFNGDEQNIRSTGHKWSYLENVAQSILREFCFVFGWNRDFQKRELR